MSAMPGQDGVDNPAMTLDEPSSVGNSDHSNSHQNSSNNSANNSTPSKTRPPGGTMVVVDRDIGPRRFQKLRNFCEGYV